jgi:hypothetical protein
MGSHGVGEAVGGASLGMGVACGGEKFISFLIGVAAGPRNYQIVQIATSVSPPPTKYLESG